jgi:hypothetical protein
LNLIEHVLSILKYNQTICQGDSVVFFGHVYKTNTFNDEFIIQDTTNANCDQIVRVSVVVIPLPETVISETICEGDSVTILGHTYKTDTSVIITVPSVPCPETILVEVTVLPQPCDLTGRPAPLPLERGRQIAQNCMQDTTLQAQDKSVTLPDFRTSPQLNLLADFGSVVDGVSDAQLTLTQTPAAGEILTLGSHTVTITATDADGNTNSCSFTVTVVE